MKHQKERRIIQDDKLEWVPMLDSEMKRQMSLSDRATSLFRCKWCSQLFDVKSEAEAHATSCSIGFEKV
jgi:hypothetical protein